MRRTGTRSASAIFLLACLTRCGASWEAGPRAPARTLPAYAGHDAELFEDGIEPGALGYEATLNGRKETDRLLAARTQASDGVVRARVVTVTSKREETGQSLQLGLRTVEKLVGRRAPDGEFTLVVDRKAPSASVLSAVEGRLVGLTFVVFVRGFAASHDDGSPDGELHFHLARDEKAENDAVRAASIGPPQ